MDKQYPHLLPFFHFSSALLPRDPLSVLPPFTSTCCLTLTDLAAFHSSSCHSPLYAPLLSAVSCVAINLLLLFHCNMKRKLRLCLSSCHTSIWNKTVDWVNTRKRYCQHFLNIFCASTLSTDKSIFLSKELKITKQWSKTDTYWQTNN